MNALVLKNDIKRLDVLKQQMKSNLTKTTVVIFTMQYYVDFMLFQSHEINSL